MIEQADLSAGVSGPWAIDPMDDLKTVTILRHVKDDEDGRSWEHLIAQISIIDGEDGNANLRLILAAPELLEAAAGSIEAIKQGEADIAMLYLRAAIDKATGGEA